MNFSVTLWRIINSFALKRKKPATNDNRLFRIFLVKFFSIQQLKKHLQDQFLYFYFRCIFHFLSI
ncbi:hypothetical protein SAMN05444412_11170 [Rhodonellum ikkaensis]|uniref:Uncharacterized protein n=1 Tax=Rhodonellum ikkaensis TaxID=336829 RepID=A0A1H3SE81_9BACT|nr:hypothetical protein SAMN05444412_11170 [Rhodonellum ikkaensis]